MEVSYFQNDNGWGIVRFAIGGTEIERRVSYLSEPLAELANLARHLLNPEYGFKDSAVRFCDEPGAIDLHVSQADLDDSTGSRFQHKIYNSGVFTYNDAEPEQMLIDVIVEELQDGMSLEPEVGTILAEERLTSLELARAVFRCLDQVLESETTWSFLEKNIAAPFPLTEYAILGAMLNEEPRLRMLW